MQCLYVTLMWWLSCHILRLRSGDQTCFDFSLLEGGRKRIGHNPEGCGFFLSSCEPVSYHMDTIQTEIHDLQKTDYLKDMLGFHNVWNSASSPLRDHFAESYSPQTMHGTELSGPFDLIVWDRTFRKSSCFT